MQKLCQKDIKLLIREDYDRKIAYESSIHTLYGKDRAKGIAVDGTLMSTAPDYASGFGNGLPQKYAS